MNAEKQKICRYCAEQIGATAKICPRCRQWLSIFSLRNPTMWIGTFCLCVAVWAIGFDVNLHNILRPGVDFLPYKNQISITESHLSFGTNAERAPIVSIIALATNQTDLAWKEIDFEARFFDKAGTLIDVAHGEYFWPLYPKSDGAVYIHSGRLRPVSDYDSYKIYVGYARDAHSRF